MASKYILSRDQFLVNESVELQPIQAFLNEIGPGLMELLDTVKPVLPESVSDEFIENSQKYSIELDSIGFKDDSKLEHILYAMGTTGVTLFTESNFQIQSVVDQYYAVNEAVIDTLRSIWNALTEDGSPMGILHLLLDIIGFIPGAWVGFPIDVVADGLNALIYLFEGQYGSALISAIAAAIPGIGDFAKTLKVAKGFRNINKLAEVAFKTGKADKALVRTLAKQDPGTLSKFLDLVKGAKPVVGFFASLAKGIGRGIEALLRTWPISILFGGIGKALGKWLDDAVEPITKNLDSAIDDINLISKGSDDITAAIKTGDASKVADTTTKVVDITKMDGTIVKNTELSDAITSQLAAAKASGNVAEVKRIEDLLQTRIEKGLPGAGQFVKNGRLIDIVQSNIKISDDLLKNPKELQKFLEEGYDEYVETWMQVQKVKGVPVTASDLNKIKEMRTLWIEGRKAEALFAGVKKLDDIPADELIKLTGNAAEISTTKGANFSARLIDEISDDPIKLSKFFNGILANPKTLAKLEEAGPRVADMYRLFAKNPKVYVDIARSGSNAVKHFEEIAKIGGKWSQAVRGSRLFRNKLIILKNLVGAPLRCPIASLGQGNVGGIDALIGKFSPGAPKLESTKFILSRNQFLLEEESADPGKTSVSAELDQQLNALKTKSTGERHAVLGPLSYVDVCQSHINKVADDLAMTATFPAKDSTYSNNITDPKYVAAGVASEAAIENQEAVDNTLKQFGIDSPISSAGMMVNLPSDATVVEVAEERINGDAAYGGLWFMLGAVMTNDIPYSDIKSKIKSALAEYESRYKRTVGNTKTTGDISFYPAPVEVDYIKNQLRMLEEDPSHEPRFFGPGVSSSDLMKMF
jgi:hypothetical protein